MTLSLLLIGYAVLAGVLGAAVLRAARWPQQAPRVGVLAWLALATSTLVAGILAVLTMVAMAAMHPGLAIVCAIGVVAGVAAVGRLLFCAAHAGADTRTARRRQHALLDLVARHDPHLDALVVDHPASTAYCLPGRPDRVVVTSAAVESLRRDQLEAVLAHERAHLRGRHHLAVAATEVLGRAFPFVPAFAAAADAVPRLVEMAADDAAVRDHERLTLATALVRLAEGAAPVAALGARGDTAVLRIRRLAAPPARLGLMRTSIVFVAATLTVVAPMGLSAGAAVWWPFLQTCL
jgi:Zn-dependent protease with chaperone function